MDFSDLLGIPSRVTGFGLFFWKCGGFFRFVGFVGTPTFDSLSCHSFLSFLLEIRWILQICRLGVGTPTFDSLSRHSFFFSFGNEVYSSDL